MKISNLAARAVYGMNRNRSVEERGIIIVGGKPASGNRFMDVTPDTGFLARKGQAPGQDKAIIIVGGVTGSVQAAMNRGIIIVSGRALVRG